MGIKLGARVRQIWTLLKQNFKYQKRVQYLLPLGSIGLAGIVVIFAFQNCSKVSVADVAKSTEVLKTEVPVVDPGGTKSALKIGNSNDFVCSAFGSITVPSDRSGLKTELRYISADSQISVAQRNQIKVVDYFSANASADFIVAPQSIYLTDVNIPNRRFENGFTTSDGSTLKDNQGSLLIEYFALKMETVLKLGANDPEGYYELSTVSDDGTVLQIMQNGQWVTLIDNDGSHATRMGCMSNKIYIDKQSRIQTRLFYNQGPRTQISNVLIWNYRGSGPLTPSTVASDASIHTYCGATSTEEFWASATSAPNTWIKNVFAAGWKVLAADNFQLPDNEVNPCAFSTYDVSPEIEAEALANGDTRIHLKSKDSIGLEVKLYVVLSDQSKVLLSDETQAENFLHSFLTGPLDQSKKYQLELVMQVPSKQLKVLKVYSLSF